MASVADVKKRWQGFLQKLEERHSQLLVEAEVGCLQLLDLAALDTLPMSNAWQGVHSQLLQLTSKVRDTWDEKVSDAFEQAYEDAGLDDDSLKELEAGERLAELLDENELRAEAKIFGEAAERLMRAAQEELGKTFHCTQCRAQLPVRADVFRAYHVTCNYCETVNTFEPGTRVRAVEHFCAQRLADRETLELKTKMNRQWDAVRAHRSPPLAMLQSLEQAVMSYWQAYFEKRAEIVPAYLKDLTKDVESRLRSFYVDMGRQDNWQQPGWDPRFNQERIYRHLQQVGASIAATAELPQRIYTHFVQVFDEDEIKTWLSELWEQRLRADVEGFYAEDLELYRQLMPAPKTALYDGFIAEMNRFATVVKRTKRTSE